MMKNEIRVELKKTFLKLSILGLGAFALFSVLGFVVFSEMKLNLAVTLTDVVINSVVIKDMRAVVNTLNTAVPAQFDAISFLTSVSEVNFELPNSRAFSEVSNSMVIRKITIPIVTSGNKFGTLVFMYSLKPFFVVLFVLLAALAGAIYFIFTQLSIRIEKKHSEQLNQREAEVFNQVARQVAHDIRSPLSAINLAIDAAKLDTTIQELIQNSVKRINEIANDLLQKSNEKSNETVSVNTELISPQFNLETVCLPDLLKGIVLEKEHSFKIQKLSLNFQCEETAQKLNVKVDSKELQRVVSNILDNAAEASYSGLQVLVKLTSSEEHAKIDFIDKGQGMPKAMIAQIGKSPISSKKDISKMGSGSGIGLYHAVKTIEGFGGAIDIKSQLGMGTTITLTLPTV